MRMKIDKVLNNNTAICLDEAGEEIILIGRGLTFGKRPGSPIDMKRVEKTFAIHDPQLLPKFKQLIKSIPLKHALLSEKIIQHAKRSLGKELSETIYISLPDHISSAIERHKQGISLPNLLLVEIRQFYREEYEVGLMANNMIAEETGIQFPDDEAGFIAMHLVNAELGGSIGAVYQITELTQSIYQLVCEHIGFQPDQNSIHYYRFLTHLKFFAQRIVGNTQYGDDLSELLSPIQEKYPKAHEIAQMVCDHIEKSHHFYAGENEILYLTVHIARLLDA